MNSRRRFSHQLAFIRHHVFFLAGFPSIQFLSKDIMNDVTNDFDMYDHKDLLAVAEAEHLIFNLLVLGV